MIDNPCCCFLFSSSITRCIRKKNLPYINALAFFISTILFQPAHISLFIIYSVCNNPHSEQRLKLELTFVESKIKYLKDQLAELNCDFTLYKMKNANGKPAKPCLKPEAPVAAQFKTSSSSSASSSSYNSPTISGSSFTTPSCYSRLLHRESSIGKASFKPLPELSVWSTSSVINDPCDLIANTTTSINTDSFSPSSSSSSALTITPTETPTPLSKSNSDIRTSQSTNSAEEIHQQQRCVIAFKSITNDYNFAQLHYQLQSNLVNPALLLSGKLLFGQNFITPELFIIPIHVSIRTKYTVIRKRLIRNKFNRILNFFHIYKCIC